MDTTSSTPTTTDPSSAEAPAAEPPLTPDEMGELAPEATLFVADGLVRLSFSSIDTYLNCPAKFRFGYVFRIPSTDVAIPLIFGSAVHHALEKFHAGDLQTMPGEDDLRDWLREAWEVGGFDKLGDAENANQKRRAWRVVTSYRNRMAQSWRPAAGTEVWFEVPFANDAGEHEAMVVGSIDRLDIDPDGAMHVVDYKTNKKVKSRRHIATDLQLSIYALAVEHLFGRLPATVALDFVVPGEIVRVPVSDLDLDAARQAVIDTARAVKAAAFAPTPNPLCDWCDHKAICPAWEGKPGESLGEAEAQIRDLRRDTRRTLKMLAEKQDALATLSAEVAATADVQAVGLEVEAAERREQRRLRREQAAAEAAATPKEPHGPTLDLQPPDTGR